MKLRELRQNLTQVTLRKEFLRTTVPINQSTRERRESWKIQKL